MRIRRAVFRLYLSPDTRLQKPACMPIQDHRWTNFAYLKNIHTHPPEVYLCPLEVQTLQQNMQENIHYRLAFKDWKPFAFYLLYNGFCGYSTHLQMHYNAHYLYPERHLLPIRYFQRGPGGSLLPTRYFEKSARLCNLVHIEQCHGNITSLLWLSIMQIHRVTAQISTTWSIFFEYIEDIFSP